MPDTGTAVPASTVTEYLVKRFAAQPEKGHDAQVAIVASLAVERPGPFRVLAAWPDTDDAIDEAELALADLAVILSINDAGVLRWGPDGWSWVDVTDEPPIVE